MMIRILAVLLVGAAIPAAAHELRPAYLEISGLTPERVRVRFKQPVLGDYALPLHVSVPEHWQLIDAEKVARTGMAVVRETTYDPRGPLTGQRVVVEGLEASLTDALVRVELLDGTELTRILKPAAPGLEIPSASASWVGGYLQLGIEHILRGIDHLLFVLGLLVIVGGRWRMLLKTITAFTLAHSLTLAAATLGWIRVPAAPLEASIALSILFLGVEIARQMRGGTSFTIAHPWVAAFAFGLLHGLGFASGLSTLGFSTHQLVAALLLFNVGVEIGQLGFVAVCLALRRMLDALPLRIPDWAKALPAYTIGSLGAYWAIVQTARAIAGDG